MNTAIQMIPVNKLSLSPANVRKTHATIEDLLASIPVHGLLQNLVVSPDAKKRGHFLVHAGGRRLRACQQLITDKRLPKAFEVPCSVRADADAVETSLAENRQREAMHPYDEFAAFQQLADTGQSTTDIAARFGVTERIVKQRLRLARVHPTLRDLYREGKLSLDVLEAFTVNADQERQLAVWEALDDWDRKQAPTIRRRLTTDTIKSTHPLVRFVGLDAYRAAGGALTEDLFGTDSYLADAALLDRLAREKLDAARESLNAEGWAWTDTRLDLPHDELRGYSRAAATARKPSGKEAKALKALKAESDALQDKMDELAEAEDESSEEAFADLETRYTAKIDEIDAFEKSLLVYSDEARKLGGAIVTIDSSGNLAIERGLIRAEDRAAAKGKVDLDRLPTSQASTAQREKRPKDVAEVSDALAMRLTEARSHALRLEISRQPKVALIALIHTLATDAVYKSSGTYRTFTRGILDIDVSRYANAHTDSGNALGLELANLAKRLPTAHADLVPYLADLSIDELQAILATLTAATLCAVMDTARSAATRNGRDLRAIEQLADLAKLDMRTHWTATAETYLGSVSKAHIQHVLTEATGAPDTAVAKMPKAQAVEHAAPILATHQWLPKLLRAGGTVAHLAQASDDDDIAEDLDQGDDIDE
jgi:ParB family chromosome partitioning protein